LEKDTEKSNEKLAVVILAAGKGTRMKANLPKVLHEACGRPIINYVLDATCALNPGKTIVVVGHEASKVTEVLPAGITIVKQDEQLGTGHAVKIALSKVGDCEEILVLPGDSPLVRESTLRELISARRERQAASSMLVTELENPTGYGRVVRNISGGVARVVEEADATGEERQIKEVNACTYAFLARHLTPAIESLKADNIKGEYYLTDVVQYMVERGLKVFPVFAPPEEVLGVNDREQLSEVESVLRKRILGVLMRNGVTIKDPESTFIDFGVEVGSNTTIMPFCLIFGETLIGKDCTIGPFTTIRDSKVGDSAVIEFSWIEGCEILEGARIGPFSRLRNGCLIGESAKVGSFVEMKKTTLGKGSKVPHLSYMGDAKVGSETNIGAGTITCNYDGENKYETEIGDRAFIGSDTMLVAPVQIGDDAATGAGSAITSDVPDGHLGVERAQQVNIPNWRERRKAKKRKTKGEK